VLRLTHGKNCALMLHAHITLRSSMRIRRRADSDGAGVPSHVSHVKRVVGSRVKTGNILKED
jgi:hypothetical protein